MRHPAPFARHQLHNGVACPIVGLRIEMGWQLSREKAEISQVITVIAAKGGPSLQRRPLTRPTRAFKEE